MPDNDRAYEQQLNELRIFGFTVIENVLSDDEVAALRDFVLETEAHIGVESLHRGTARHLANLVALDPMFFQTIDHPDVMPLVEGIMGEYIILGSLNARIVRLGDCKQGLHRDVPLPLHHYGFDAPVMMNTIWPLHDYTMENGATCAVPGTR